MPGKSKIEWCTDTWNPIVGCSVVSPGCTNCYAMSQAARIVKMARAKYDDWYADVSNIGMPEGGIIEPFQNHYDGTTTETKIGAVWTGKVALAPDRIVTTPLHWQRPRRIFVNSMGDVFHDAVPDEWIDRVFAVMALCPQHTFQVLTKRSKRMREYMNDPMTFDRVQVAYAPLMTLRTAQPAKWPLPNVWLGVSAEDQRRADERIPDLLKTPAAVRWVSAEPLLGAIDFRVYIPNPLWNDLPSWKEPELDWIVVGGESGPDARSMHPDWVRSIRDQCAAAGIPFLFKQWGEWAPSTPEKAAFNPRSGWVPLNGRRPARTEDLYPQNGAAFVERVGKRQAGRELDGRLHDDYPGDSAHAVMPPKLANK